MVVEVSQAAEWCDVDRGRPAILRGLIQNWPAVQAGSALIDYLKSFYSGQPAPLFEAPAAVGGRFFYNATLDGFNFESRRAPITELFDRLTRGRGDPAAPALYAGSVSLPIYFPGFTAANHIRGLINVPSVLESIWIGNRTCIAAHFDNTDNIACVVAGRRRFTLFPPEQIGNLYVGPLDLTPAGQPISLVDIRNPDLDKFPRYAAALEVAEVAELGPGDAVYVPALWWHHVEALDDFNVLVNYWWREVPAFFDSPTSTLLHSLLTIKSLPPEQRARWKALFDYLIFQTDAPALEHLPPQVRGLFGELTEAKAERLRAMLIQSLSRR